MGRIRAVIVVGLASVAVVTALHAQQTAPDNTRVNKRDRAASEPTADQQKNNRTDLTITRDIRRAIVKDKTLSTAAHNIKVITQGGDVTLKGPVRTEAEKIAVEAKATEIAGVGHVRSEVSVAPPKSRKQKS